MPATRSIWLAVLSKDTDMNNALENATLLDGDLEGYAIDDVKCRGCNGPLCDEKTPRLYRGELVFVCHLGEPGSTVLQRASERAKGR